MTIQRRIVRIGRRRGVPRKYILAALATGRVESNFRNLPGGDADSQGWRQERRSLYRNPRNVGASIRRFYTEARQHDRGQSAGELAADVQRPAAQYRGRYSQVLASGEPQRILSRNGGGGGGERGFPSASNGTLPGRASVRIGNRSVFDQAGFEQARRRSILANFLQRSGKRDSILFRSGLLSTDAPNPADFRSNQITSKLIQGRGTRIGRQVSGNAPNLTGALGKVSISPTADRPGVHIKKGIVRFVERVAGIYGRRLTIGTGTNHSRMTVNGNVSDHWDGYAADIPLTGGALIKAGQDALIAAGMNPHKARRQHGGLYNVGGYQVIFNTHIGGDHTNHLHVGKRH